MTYQPDIRTEEKSRLQSFMQNVQKRNSQEIEFLQAVQDVAESLLPFIENHPHYKKHKILERMVEPEKVIMFRVPWMRDNGEIEINRS